MKRALASIILVSGLTLIIQCGTAPFRTGNNWQAGEERFFDDGVDLIKDPSKISGEWAYRYENELDGRVQLADMVAEIDIFSIQTTRNVDNVEAKRIEVSIENILLGDAPEKSVVLESTRLSPGHELLLRYESHLSGRFLLFIRWFANENGTLSHHFHLSPASDRVKSEVLKRINTRQKEEEKGRLGTNSDRRLP